MAKRYSNQVLGKVERKVFRTVREAEVFEKIVASVGACGFSLKFKY